MSYGLGFQARNHPQQIKVHGGADDTVDDRATRPEIFDPLHAEFGFTIDVAAGPINHKVPRYFDKKRNGLIQSWAGEVVWCNPPFSALALWAAKAVHEVTYNGCKRVVMLLPNNRCEQIWWQELIEPVRDRPGSGVATRFLRGRPRFTYPVGHESPKKGDRPPFGIVFVIFSPPDPFGAL